MAPVLCAIEPPALRRASCGCGCAPSRELRGEVGHFGFHSRANFCASAICSRVISCSTLRRPETASSGPVRLELAVCSPAAFRISDGDNGLASKRAKVSS